MLLLLTQTACQYAITVNIETTKNSEGVLFRYWSDHIGDDQARDVAQFMAHVLETFYEPTSQQALPNLTRKSMH